MLPSAQQVASTGQTFRMKTMELKDALRYVQAWGDAQGDHTYVGRMRSQPDGSFSTMGRGAFFRYDAQAKRLRVGGVLGQKADIYVEWPEVYAGVQQAVSREPSTTAQGYAILEPESFPPVPGPVLLIARDFSDATVSKELFVAEVRWLLACAQHWFSYRELAVLAMDDEENLRDAARVEAENAAQPSMLMKDVMRLRQQERGGRKP